MAVRRLKCEGFFIEMKSKEFQADNYIMCPGFAIVDLKLSGNELLCYSLIYGFTQDQESEFYGSLAYVASALNITRQNAKNVIDRLVKKGLLEKKEINFSGVKFCHYIANRNSNGVAETVTPSPNQQRGGIETVTGGVAETATHNIINSILIDNNNIDNNMAVPGLFPEEPKTQTRPKRTSEPLCLFADSRYNSYEAFSAEFTGQEYAGIDLTHYWGSVADWSSRFGKKQKDWIATARSFMRKDKEQGKLKMLQSEGIADSYMRHVERMMKLNGI